MTQRLPLPLVFCDTVLLLSSLAMSLLLLQDLTAPDAFWLHLCFSRQCSLSKLTHSMNYYPLCWWLSIYIFSLDISHQLQFLKVSLFQMFPFGCLTAHKTQESQNGIRDFTPKFSFSSDSSFSMQHHHPPGGQARNLVFLLVFSISLYILSSPVDPTLHFWTLGFIYSSSSSLCHPDQIVTSHLD